MDVSIREVSAATEAKVSGELKELPIERVWTDSRTIQKGDLFVALIGSRFDGHKFIKDAYAKGARQFVVSKLRSVPADIRRDANVWVVSDTLKAYGDLACFYRKKFKIPVIVITGSCGKTTVKELTAHVLSQRFKVLKNQGTENNLVGVPKTILGLDASHEVLVLEIGTNHPGEIERLSQIASPQIGVVTQIGTAHLEGLKSIEGVRDEKMSLMKHLERGGVLIVNAQDPMLREIQSGVHRVIRCAFSKEWGDVTAEQAWCHDKGCSYYLNGKDMIETPLIGRHNILNCLLAAAVGDALGLGAEEIQKAFSTFRPVPGRLQLKTIEGIHFLDDSYNSNPTSFKAALDTLTDFKIREKKGVVCGDMLELGQDSEKFHREMGAVIAEHLFDFVIVAGLESRALADEAVKKGYDPTRIHQAKDSVEAGKLCRELASAGDIVLVKGSRSMKMEKVFECFTTSSIR